MSPTITRPPFIELSLRKEPIEAPVVSWLQGVINESKYVMPKLAVDGKFGPHTAFETEELLYRLGRPGASIPAVGVEGLGVLWRWHEEGAPLPAAWRANRIARESAGFVKGWGITFRSWMGLHPGEFPPDAGDLVFIPREEIGLVPPRNRDPLTISPSEGAVFHWNGVAAGAVGMEAAKAQFRAWQRMHMAPGGLGTENGASDVGYHFAVPRGVDVGVMFEGRGFNVRGAHAGASEGNRRYGVLLMCGSADGGPTKEQLTTAQMFREGHARGAPFGHQEFHGTSCPGPAAMAWVRSKR